MSGLVDPTDARIVELLQADGRATQQEIAAEVKLSQPAVAERIRKLEERGVIVGYTALVDAARLGKDVTAFIGVSIEHPRHFEGFARRVLELHEVLECHRVAGDWSYLLKIKTANTGSLDHLLVDRLRTIPGVTRTATTIVLSSIKESSHVHVGEQPPEARGR
ncbi:MAG: Lrp/AsnC family transcriptional regulator [Myxococcales bacterium]